MKIDLTRSAVTAPPCQGCQEPVQLVDGDECVEIRFHAPDEAPAHDAMCEDGEALRCVNVHCGYFAVICDERGQQ